MKEKNLFINVEPTEKGKASVEFVADGHRRIMKITAPTGDLFVMFKELAEMVASGEKQQFVMNFLGADDIV